MKVRVGFSKSLLFIFLVMSSLCLRAADIHNYTLAHNITISNGLPSNTVRHIAQDRYGFIWFGTDYGLCCYDGVSIKRLLMPTPDASQYVTALLPFGDELFVGTNSGVWVYGFQTGRFKQLTAKAQDDSSVLRMITSLAVSKDATIYIGTDGNGVFSYDPAARRLIHCKAKATNVMKVYVDNDNQIWALTRTSGIAESPLLWLDHSRNSFEPIQIENLSDINIFSISMLQTKDGTYWLGTWNDGLLRLQCPKNRNLSINTPISFTLATDLPDAIHIHALHELSPDCILIGSDNGLFSYNPATGILSPFPATSNLLLPNIASPHFIYDIMTDSEGGLWTTSFYDGVHYFSEIPNRFSSYAKHQSDNSLTGNVINHFCEDARGQVWIASDDGGLNLFLPSTHQFADFANRQLLGSLNVHALSIDGDNLWIGTYSNGLYLMETQTGILHHRTDVGGESSAYSILLDSHGNHWIGTMNDVFLLNDFGSTPLIHKQLGALVIDIDEDAQGDVWFCTHGQGVWRYTPGCKRWLQYFPGRKDKADKFTGTEINCINIDGGNRIYVAAGNRIYLYDTSSDSFVEQELEDNLSDISAVIEDQGRLWLTTSTELISYRQGESLIRYGEGDGVLCGQFMPNAVMRAADGQLFFGSTHGFAYFYPHSIHPNKHAFPVYITKVEIFDRDIEDIQDNGSITMPFLKEVRLSHDDNMLTIHFAGLSYVSPSMNRYAYMLEDFDKKWNYTTGEGKAVYTNLSPGTYTFRVKAANNDGVWSDQEAELLITITPPFWWNPFAWLFYLLVIVAGGFLYLRRWKRQQEERHRLEMNELDAKRQSEVRDVQLRFYTTIAHEIRTPVSLITAPMEALFEKLNGNPIAPISEYRDMLQVVYRNANRLLELVNQLLDFNKVQQGQYVHFDLCNIHKLIRGVTDRFVPTLQQQNIAFVLNLPDEQLSAIVDYEAITKVVSNLMTNARKYTRSQISLTVSSDAEQFSIIVEDDGMGIHQSDMKRIFTPFFQARNNKPGTGIGLSIVKNIVDAHHGEINVESEEGKGSKFVITLPLRQNDVTIGDTETRLEDNHEKAQSEESAEGEVAWNTPDDGTPILLIVEDDYDMLHFLTDNFRSSYTVITAENGKKGLEQVRRNNVTIIISDWMMPDMDGREFCQRIRSDAMTSHIPFVMLTARTDADSKAEGMECGADMYIEKPFSIKYLNACIKNILGMRRLLFEKFSASVETKISDIAPTPVDNTFLQRINEIIEENVSNPDFSMNTLAREMGISRSSLFSKIKGITNATPNEMLMVVRLRKAAVLLIDGRYRVNEVCYMVGFNNPSYFTKCFQKQFGVKPSEYCNGGS